MLNGLHRGSLSGCVLLAVAMPNQLLAGERILALTKSCEVLRVDTSSEAVLFGHPTLPFSENGVALLPIILFGGHELFGVISLRLAGTERFGDGEHGAVSNNHWLRLGNRHIFFL